MRHRVELTYDEMRQLLTAGTVARSYEPSPTLHRALRRLGKTMDAALCKHCHERPYRRSNRLCDRCNAYLHAYGTLPSEPTLRRTAGRILDNSRIPSV
jgi:hypothetical protein